MSDSPALSKRADSSESLYLVQYADVRLATYGLGLAEDLFQGWFIIVLCGCICGFICGFICGCQVSVLIFGVVHVEDNVR